MKIWSKIKSKLKENKVVKNILNRRFARRKARIENRLIKITHKYGYAINNKVYELLNGRVNFFALAGTLLGIVRENKFIEYDNDLDYGIVVEDKEQWRILYDILTNHGFKFAHYFEKDEKITEMAFRYKGVHVDFFGVFVNDGVAGYSVCYWKHGIQYCKGQASTMKVSFEYRAGTFEKIANNSVFLIPNCYHEFLSANYGNNYMTPIRGVEVETSCGSRQFFDNDYTIMKDQFIV